MSFTTLFILRPVTTILLMSGLLIFGLLGYITLPVSDLPPVEYPTITVSAALPGANPDTMAATVATPLERQFSTIAGLETMYSNSYLGRTSITLQFVLERNIDAAAQDVQAAISQAARSLPPDMPAPPSYNKVNPADQPVLYMTLKSPTMPLSQVDEYAQTMLAQRISMVSGVAQVMIFGTQKYAVRVQVDPDKLAAHGIGIDEVRQAIGRGSVNLPAGALYGESKAYTVQSNSQLNNAAGFRPLIVAYRNGNPVRLEQIARVMDSVQNDKSAFWESGKRAMTLAVQKQPGTNTVAVVDGIKKLLPALREQMPADLRLDITFDRSQTIRESIADVKATLWLTIGLVILVIFAFLRNVSATMIPSLAVPLSLIGTFAAMYLLGYSVDNLSMMAMILSVGFVVDDAIVMLENIVRHMEMGKPRMQAAIEGAREIGFTIISMTLSLTAVFIPVLFLGGIVGRLLREFSVVIAIAVLISGVISLTLTPMLGSRLLKRHSAERHNRLYDVSESLFNGLLGLYDRTLRFTLRHRFATLSINIALAVLTGFLFYKIPKGFVPEEDVGSIFGGTEAAEETSFARMVELQSSVAETIGKSPYVRSAFYGVGSDRGGAQNSGFVFARLIDRKDRPPADQIIAELRPQLMRIPGINTFLRVPPAITLGQSGRSLYVVTLQDADTDLLYEWAPRLEARMKQLPALQDVNSDLRLASPRVNVDIERDKALALGVTPEAVANALFSAYGNRQVATINTASNEYYVIMEVLPEYQRDPSALSKLYLQARGERLVPLSAVTTVNTALAPLAVNHVGQLPAVNISFNTSPGAALGDAVNQIEETGRQLGLPGTTALTFQGTAQAFQQSLKGLGMLLIIAVLVIYLVMGILYESFIHPITILSGLPSAGLGALATLMLFRHDLNLYGFVGLILLIGIVKKNAIMMIDFALAAQRNEGQKPADAIYHGCLLRFRPIMMTTMAAMLGALPIALGLGAGGESRRPLGLAVVGGLMVSQLLTLYLTPVVYLYLDRVQQFLTRKQPAPAPPAVTPLEPKPEELVRS
ncbi:MAG: efflux RND transporter permease subunit [Bryobacteraceae bacterium]|nr:efflux RND transporter permease subunit [Bryobacteraceae bacterium]